MYQRELGQMLHYSGPLLQGLTLTIFLTLLALFFGTLCGLVLATMRLSKEPSLVMLGQSISTLFVSLPLLVVLIWLYYAFPLWSGLRMTAFGTAVVALSANLAGFAADIFVAGWHAIAPAQYETARVCQLSRWQIIKHIMLPQLLQLIAAPLAGRYVETIKLTSLAAIISVNELLHVGQTIISSTYRPLEVYTMVAVLYLWVIIPLLWFVKRLGRSTVL